MNSSIAEIGNHDLRHAAVILYRASAVLRNLPATPADPATKAMLFESAKLTVRAVKVILANIAANLECIEVDKGFAS